LRTAVLLLGERDIFVRTDLGLGIGVLFKVSAAPAAALPQSPSQSHSLRGRSPGLGHRSDRSSAPIEYESQSFLSNILAFCRRLRPEVFHDIHRCQEVGGKGRALRALVPMMLRTDAGLRQ
jgi:hypothetical protein